MSSCAGGYVGPVSGCEAIEIEVQCLNGEGCKFSLNRSALGRGLWQMVSQQLPSKKGRKITWHHKDTPLLLAHTLQEQGILGRMAAVFCTFVPTDLHAALLCPGIPCFGGRVGTRGSDKHWNYILPEVLRHSLLAKNSTRPSTDWGCQTVSRLWHLALISTRPWKEWACQAVFRLWHLALISTRLLFSVAVELPAKLTPTAGGSEPASSLQSLTFGFAFNQPLEGTCQAVFRV